MGTSSSSPAVLPRPDRLVPRGGPPRRSRRARWRTITLIAVHVAILGHVVHWQLTGSSLSPVEPSEAMETLEFGAINAGFVALCLLLLVTLVAGRFFCGWACHVVAYQDLCAWLLARFGLRPRPVRSRLLVWVPAGAAFYMFFWPTLHRWWSGTPSPDLEWQLSTTDFWATFPGPAVALLTLAIDGFLVVYWLGAKGFCTYGCPYGALFGGLDRWSPTRIRVTDACETCGHCTATCTSNVRVHEEVARFGMVVDTGCMKCLDCVDVCPKDALFVGTGRPAGLRRGRRKLRSDFSWGEEIALVALFAGGLFAFRSLYAAVPFLLALGLAVLLAVAGITTWRLLRQRDFGLQHTTWRRDGRWTTAGRIGTATLGLFLLFAVHSATVQYFTWSGERAATDAAEGPQRTAALARAEDHLSRAASLGLAVDPRVYQTRGLVRRERGAFAEAEADFERALEARPDWPAAAIPLADLLMLRGERERAEQMLRAVLAAHPDLPPARQRLERLGGRATGR